MPNLEIVTTDEDVVAMTVSWIPGEEAFVTTQRDRGDFKSSLVLQIPEAKQLIAALTAFVEGKNAHMSDCALHNSPAEPIDFCNCSAA